MIGNVYDYYLTTYANKSTIKNTTHKKSELRSVYNNIVKISKQSPLYKLDISEDMQKYAIDLKENARALTDDVNNIFPDNDFTSSRQKYSSEDESIVTVNVLKDNEDASNEQVDEYNIEVNSLATPQRNTSNYLGNNSLDIPYGDQKFEVNIGNNTYEFQFKTNNDDTNKSIFEKLSRLINRSNIGLNSKVIGDNSNSALEIASDATGLTFDGQIFSVSPSSDNNYKDVVDVLGLNNVSSLPTNANFILNGMDKTSSSNTFTINKSIEFSLNGVSTDNKPTKISLNDDLDTVISSVKDFVNSYNNLIDLSDNSEEASKDPITINKEISKSAMQYKNELESLGISIGEDKKLTFDDSLFIQSSKENSLNDSLAKLDSFKNSICSKANDISINPMKYVNKVMISYPNPVRSFANPYITSIYSGMMYNGYV